MNNVTFTITLIKLKPLVRHTEVVRYMLAQSSLVPFVDLLILKIRIHNCTREQSTPSRSAHRENSKIQVSKQINLQFVSVFTYKLSKSLYSVNYRLTQTRYISIQTQFEEIYCLKEYFSKLRVYTQEFSEELGFKIFQIYFRLTF